MQFGQMDKMITLEENDGGDGAEEERWEEAAKHILMLKHNSSYEKKIKGIQFH